MPAKTSDERGRITARLPLALVTELEEAAALVGVTVNQFVVQAAAEKARTIIEACTRIDLSRRDAEFIADLLEAPPAPNAALIKAARQHKKIATDTELHAVPGATRRPRH
jgi:uncharacterized protein (DUF1778 family)